MAKKHKLKKLVICLPITPVNSKNMRSKLTKVSLACIRIIWLYITTRVGFCTIYNSFCLANVIEIIWKSFRSLYLSRWRKKRKNYKNIDQLLHLLKHTIIWDLFARTGSPFATHSLPNSISNIYWASVLSQAGQSHDPDKRTIT